MKLLLLTAFVVIPFLSLSARADDEASSSAGTMKINQGDIQLGGEANLTKPNTGGWTVEASPKLEYFFLNRFSAGGRIDYVDGDTTPTTVSFGPAATYYFALIRKTGFYVDQTLSYVKAPSGSDNYFHGETGIGINYFIVPNVAVGPVMRGYYNFNGGQGLPTQGTKFRVAISAFF